jgi:hypothetical protein
MRRKQSIVLGIVVAAALGALRLASVAYAHDDVKPTNRQIAFAQQVSELMVNEIVAALFAEFDETTPGNVEHGKQAISLIFNDVNRDMRLIGAFGPLLGGSNDRPSDTFERSALRRALTTGDGQTAVQRVNETWVYRRSVPLSNTMHPHCVLCHTNFTAEFFDQTDNPSQTVGALVLSVPIRTSSSNH